MVVAFYKAFNGHEWVEASLKSIYKRMDKIVFLNTMMDWKGNTGNTVKKIIYKWKEKNDCSNKIHIIEHTCRCQFEQYRVGISFIKNKWPGAWAFMVDCDEVWDDERLIFFLKDAEKINHNTILTQMFTYVKTPFFMVWPPEILNPVVIVKDLNTFKGIRGSESPDKYCMERVKFHHFTYVRWEPEDIVKKIELSRDGENALSVDLDWWVREKWNMLPAAKNFHPHPHYQHSWAGIKVVKESDLPATVRGTPIVEKYRNY
jgi:hypothetical protein